MHAVTPRTEYNKEMSGAEMAIESDEERVRDMIADMCWPMVWPKDGEQARILRHTDPRTPLDAKWAVYGNVVSFKTDEFVIPGMFLPTKKSKKKNEQIKLGITFLDRNMDFGFSIPVPGLIKDPLHYFARVLAMRQRMRLVLFLPADAHEHLYKKLFDTAPDSRRILSISLSYVDQVLIKTECNPRCMQNSGDYMVLPYSRDNMDAFNRFVIARTDTLVMSRVAIRREVYKNDDLLAALSRASVTVDPHCYSVAMHFHDRRPSIIVHGDELRSEAWGEPFDSLDVIAFSVVGPIRYHTREAFTKIIGADVPFEMHRGSPNVISVFDPNGRVQAWRLTKIFSSVASGESGLTGISWHHVHADILNIAVAVEPLGLSDYVWLFILEWLDVCALQRTHRVVDLLFSVFASCRRVRLARVKE